MIKITDDIKSTAYIWCEAFGDSYTDVKFFHENLRNGRCIGYFENDSLLSMLYLLDCKLDGRDSHYVYAACTIEEYKKNGYMTKILEYVKENYDSVCLIPANEDLIEYYKKRGLTFEYSKESISFDECEDLLDNYLFEGCSLDKPIILSNKGE